MQIHPRVLRSLLLLSSRVAVLLLHVGGNAFFPPHFVGRVVYPPLPLWVVQLPPSLFWVVLPFCSSFGCCFSPSFYWVLMSSPPSSLTAPGAAVTLCPCGSWCFLLVCVGLPSSPQVKSWSSPYPEFLVGKSIIQPTFLPHTFGFAKIILSTPTLANVMRVLSLCVRKCVYQSGKVRKVETCTCVFLVCGVVSRGEQRQGRSSRCSLIEVVTFRFRITLTLAHCPVLFESGDRRHRRMDQARHSGPGSVRSLGKKDRIR